MSHKLLTKKTLEVLRRGIEDIAPGIPDSEIDDLLSRAIESEGQSKAETRRLRERDPIFDLMSDIGEARSWVMKADALHDPDIVLLRNLSERQRATVLHFVSKIESQESWDGRLSKDFLVLPPKDAGDHRALSVATVKSSGSPFALLAPWFASTAMRISMEYRVVPEFAFGFLLLDSYWRQIPWVGIELKRFGAGPLDARIYLDIDSMASDEEVLNALRMARVGISVESAGGSKRELRKKTVALACLFAVQLSEGVISNSSVNWETLMELWNGACELGNKTSWTYTTNRASGAAAHQFARDVKHALEAVRGAKTKFPIQGDRKRKPVN